MANAVLTVMVELKYTSDPEEVQARVAELLAPHHHSNNHRNPDWTWKRCLPITESARFNRQNYAPGDPTYAFLSADAGWHETGESECGNDTTGDDWDVRFRGLYEAAAAVGCKPYLYEYQD